MMPDEVVASRLYHLVGPAMPLSYCSGVVLSVSYKRALGTFDRIRN